MITVYSKPKCVQCDATKRLMKQEEIPYNEIDVTEDEQALTFVKELGYLAVPVVYVNENNHWSSFQPDKIKELNDVNR